MFFHSPDNNSLGVTPKADVIFSNVLNVGKEAERQLLSSDSAGQSGRADAGDFSMEPMKKFPPLREGIRHISQGKRKSGRAGLPLSCLYSPGGSNHYDGTIYLRICL